MPRMFDILKGKVEFEPPPKPPSKKKESSKNTIDFAVTFPRQIRDAFYAERKLLDASQEQDASQVSKKLIEAVKQKGIDSIELAKEKYEYALKIVEDLLDRVNREELIDTYIDEIYRTVDVLTNQLILGDSLLEDVVEEGSLKNYLPRHITNVCILSLSVGMRMRFNKSRLHVLGVASLLHDIGMMRVKDIIEQPRKLSDEELKEIRTHTWEFVKFFPKTETHYDFIKEIIKQHHERENGAGYPLGLTGTKINEYAKIIALVDTYEAMTHPRCFRKAKVPHEVIKEIMHSIKLFFDSEAIKALVDKLSIYPVGSFVKLNNREIAKVISSNPDSPLRPFVLVMFDAYGKYMSERKTVDLSKNNSIYIKGPAYLNEIGYKDSLKERRGLQ